MVIGPGESAGDALLGGGQDALAPSVSLARQRSDARCEDSQGTTPGTRASRPRRGRDALVPKVFPAASAAAPVAKTPKTGMLGVDSRLVTPATMKWVRVGLIAGILTMPATILLYYVLGLAIDTAWQGGNLLRQWFWLLAGLVLLKAALAWVFRTGQFRASSEAKLNVRDRIHKKVVELGPGLLGKRRTEKSPTSRPKASSTSTTTSASISSRSGLPSPFRSCSARRSSGSTGSWAYGCWRAFRSRPCSSALQRGASDASVRKTRT